MRAQAIIQPNSICAENEIYFRANGRVLFDDTGVLLQKHTSITTNTYMNVFDLEVWYKYTGIGEWLLKIQVGGKGIVSLYSDEHNQKKQVCKMRFETELDAVEEIEIPFSYNGNMGLIYFEIDAEEECILVDAGFETAEKVIDENQVQLGMIICTYKRSEELYRTLEQLKQSRFFDEADKLYGKMSVCIIDNASELQEIREPHVAL